MIREKPYYDQMTFDFNEHIAIQKDNVIEFGIPNSGFYRMHFILVPETGLLIVWGDLGNAMYNWYWKGLTFEDIVNMDCHYFHSKCVSSIEGIPFNKWYPDRAKESVGCQLLERLNYLNDCLEEKKEDRIDTYKEFMIFLNDMFNFDSFHEFAESLTQFPYSFFDCDDYDCGYGIDPECYIHLTGLKKAVEYLKKTKSVQKEEDKK